MKIGVWAVFVIAAMVPLLGCGGPPRATVAVVEARSIDPNSQHAPSRFASETQYQVDRIGNRLRRDIEHGKTSAGAIVEYNQQRAYVSQLLSQYSADQYIQETERDHVRSVVHQMEEIDDRYRIAR